MDPITQQQALAAAGAAGSDPVYVDDVFSTYLYEGTSAAQTITNGIDLSGEGGMVWAKSRSQRNHIISDTERGTGRVLFTNLTNGDDTDSTTITSYNSDGFTMGTSTAKMNTSGEDFCSWTFRKCPGFFDVVTYSGNGSNGHEISHNLGSTPGMIIIKNLGNNNRWFVWHRSLGDDYIYLNEDSAKNSFGDFAYLKDSSGNYAAPTSTTISLSSDTSVNSSSYNYVMYVFAHDDQSFGTDSDEAVIKCGSYTGNGTSGHEINVGFEPQWIMIKRTSGSQNWFMFDSMRGIATGGNDAYLQANQSTDEQTADDLVDLTATGFKLKSTNTTVNGSGSTYIYVAIRRPNKPPETATDVFDVNTESNDNNYSTTGFPVDAAISINRDGSSHTPLLGARIIGDNILRTGLTNAEQAYLTYSTAYAFNDKFRYAFWGSNTNGFVNYAFKRAPGFFDVVNVDSTTSAASTFNHNLGVAPEFILAKRRDSTSHWYADQVNNYLRLNTTAGNLGTPVFNTFTSTQFSVDAGTFSSGESWIVYLFASLDGISKVGSYTGTGSNIDVDCGFSAGARFVMIKRTDATGDWAVFDSSRGIVSGNDPYSSPNNDAAENSNLDAIDPLNSGFTITSTASAMLNASGGTYMFLAIA